MKSAGECLRSTRGTHPGYSFPMLPTLCLAVLAPTKFVVVDRLMIAQLQGKRWKEVAESAASTKKVVLMGLGFGGKATPLTINGFGKDQDIGGVFVRTDSYENGVWTYGLKPSWPRKARALSTTSTIYLNALGNFLNSKGISGTPHLNAVWSIDLDRDGTQEVFLEGASEGFDAGKTANPAASDYSVVLLRSVGRAGVKTTALYSGPHKETGLDFARIRSIVDLDGDGRMEIIMSHDYYEGQAAALFTYRAGKLIKVVDFGAGV